MFQRRKKSRRLDHQKYTFMYFRRMRSHSNSSVFNIVWRHFEWMVSSHIVVILNSCWIFIKFIYVWVLPIPLFYLILSTNDLHLHKHISLNTKRSTFGPLKGFENSIVFWGFQVVKNRTLVQYGLRTYLMLLNYCKQMHYFFNSWNFQKSI